MAAPNLQAQGSISAVGSGTLTPVIPTHQADDILILSLKLWAPNTSGNTDALPTPSGWTQIRSQGAFPLADKEGEGAIYWKRATSSSETNPACAYGGNWDTSGPDHVYAGRVYVIRGCNTTGDPFEYESGSGGSSANHNLSAMTVSGSERMAVHFCSSDDNITYGSAPTGYTAGTAVTDTTGTDSAFQTYRADDVSSSISSIATTNPAPNQGYNYYFGVVFTPVAGAVETSKDSSTKASIVVTETKDSSVKALIVATETKDNSVKANILSEISKDNNVKVNIITTYYSGATYDWKLTTADDDNKNRGYQS